jgi:multiple sugar transport system substrate-binding protein
VALKDNFKKNSLFIFLFFLSIFIFIYISNLLASPKNKEFYKDKYNYLERLVKNQFNDEQKQKNYFNNYDKKVEVIFWHNLYPEEKTVLDNVIKDFEEKYPSIKIKEVNKSNWGNISKSVANALPVDKQPNLVFSYPDHVAFYSKSHKVVPLDIFINGDEDFQKNEFYGTYLKKNELKDEYDSKQHYYSLPFSKTTETLFYNKNIFLKHRNILNQVIGIDFINEEGMIYGGESGKDLNWEQLKIIAKKLKELNKENKGYIPIVVESEANLLITAFQQTGIKFPENYEEAKVFLNKDEVQKKMKYFKEEFYNKGYITTSKMNGEQKTLDMFYQQKNSIFITSTRMVRKIQEGNFDVGLSRIPIIKDGQYKNVMQGANINMFYSSNNDEMLASWLFLKTLTSKNILVKLLNAKGGLNITRDDVFKEVEKAINNDKTSDITVRQGTLHFDSLQYAYDNQHKDNKEQKEEKKMFFEPPIFPNSTFLRTVLTELFTYILAIDEKINGVQLNKQIESLCEEAAKRIATN